MKQLTYSYFFFILFLFNLLNLPFPEDSGQIYASTHSYLKKKENIKRFKNISLKLVCQCGCKMLLDSCNHLTCMAWSMRSMIDSLILHGYSDEFILNGFENGFQSLVHNKKLFPILEDERYRSYINSYEEGFGSAVHSQPKGGRLTLWILIFAFMIVSYGIFFIYRKRRKLPQWEEKSKQELTEDEKKLWEEFHRG